MRCLMACCFSLMLLSAVGGCRSCERVETELRARENDVRELREELDRCGVYNQTLQQEVHTLRGQLGVPPHGLPPGPCKSRSSRAIRKEAPSRRRDNFSSTPRKSPPRESSVRCPPG
jgi:hypothetical protein